MSREPGSCSNHSSENGSSTHHVIPIDESFLSKVADNMQKSPTLLNRSAGGESCCIFRVPRGLSEINEKAYRPRIISIGPFHHGEPDFDMIQEHKWRLLSDLLLRVVSSRLVLKDFFEAVAPMEEEIRKSYSETLNFNGPDLIQMMVLDGCFIIELFCKAERIDPRNLNDPLFTMAWVLPSLMMDLLRLENQIPYFVLQKLFDLSVGSGNDGPSLAKLAFGFFNCTAQREVIDLEKYYDKEGKHLLDLIRMSYIPDRQPILRRGSRFLHPIQCAKKLDQAGVKFRPMDTDSILDIQFRNGVLEIPVLSIDDLWSSLFLNFVAFEQCYRLSLKYITAYVTLMGCLINTPADAGFLGDLKIIKNYFGTDKEVANFFNKVGKDVVFDIRRTYLSEVFEEVNKYCQNTLHVQWAGFKHTYFSTPWSGMSASAALLLLILTMLQSFFAVYSYFRPRANNK